MEIPRSRYAQGHLDDFIASTGIDDWFTFLDQPSRLIDLMKIAKPATLSYFENEYFCWEEVGGLILGDFYGLWPNASNAELFVAKRVENLNLCWVKTGCLFDNDTANANKILEKYQQIISYETPEQFYDEKVIAYQAKIAGVRTVEEFERANIDMKLVWDDWYCTSQGSGNGST